MAIGHSGAGDFQPGPPVTRGPGLVYSGLQIIRTEGLTDIPEPAFSLNKLWDRMLGRGTLHIVRYDGAWCDVGRPEGIILAEDMLAQDV
jgi:MurNAc alpha-1-phosphate uridylyltransferase